jgi:hypothetical protein
LKSLNDLYQLVILDSPIENWDDSDTQNVFTKMVTLKKKGYESCYQQGVLPVDTSDFFATHVVLFEKNTTQDLMPVMGYKTISFNKCQDFNQTFPGLALVTNSKMPDHIEVVKSIMARCENEKRNLAYLGSWTKNPQYVAPVNVNLKDAFRAFYRLVYREQNVHEVLIGGTLRFRTEKLFFELGHRPLELNGEPLPPIHVAHLVKEPVLVMHSAKFKDNVTQAAEKAWAEVWENRIEIGLNSEIKKLPKAV